MPAAAHNITATFVGSCAHLTLDTVGNGGLAASPTASAGCSNGSYIEGENISLLASPDSGWRVSSWAGTDDDGSAANTNAYTMGVEAHTVTVTFEPEEEMIYTSSFEME